MKKSMIIYTDWHPLIMSLPDDKRLRFYDVLFSGDKTLHNIDDPHLKGILSYIFNQISDNDRKYDEKCEKAKAAIKKRWEKTNAKEYDGIQNNTSVYERIHNDKDNDKDNVNVNDKDKDKDKDNVIIINDNNNILNKYKTHPFFESKEFSEIWQAFILTKKKKKAITDPKNMLRQLAKLHKLSAGHLDTAIEIVTKSVDSGWSDLYELKTQNNNGTTKSQYTNNAKAASLDRMEELARAVIQSNTGS